MRDMPSAADGAPILVVDDDPKILQLVRMYLEREGFAIITAADGMAAVAAIRERAPRLLVLDLMLPTLDGFAVLRAARADSDLPVLMLSARGSTADRVTGIASGADDYLPKPFSPAELVVRVKALLRRSAARNTDSTTLLELGDIVIDRERHEVRRLLDSLYGKGESDVLDRTIDVYIRRLRDKLGDDPESPRYIATVRGAGYRALLGR